VQAAEHIPIETFPGPAAVVQRQIEQRQRRVVDLSVLRGIVNLLLLALSYSLLWQAQPETDFP
jgi:hypothetical protein